MAARLRAISAAIGLSADHAARRAWRSDLAILIPLTNRRQYKWGGSLENRARFLMAVLAAVREAVGEGFPIGIKLNSSDFQKGGFTSAECSERVKMLKGTSLDLLVLSGGSVEQPKVMGIT